jgi:sec-independent protein translocase protein TatB
MFDIGWSELVVIAVVALIAIGPKELPGVLRMIGQWMGKARKMASEFQGQFQEAMREAEMADLKKSFEEVREAAANLKHGNVMTSLQKDVTDALNIDGVDKAAASTDTPEIDATATSNVDAPTTSNVDAAATPKVDALATSKVDAPEVPIPETFTEADAQALASQPLAITREVQPQSMPQDSRPENPDVLKDAKAS